LETNLESFIKILERLDQTIWSSKSI